MTLLGKTLADIEQGKEISALQQLEAVLFVSGKFLSIEELIQLTNLNPMVIRESLETLKDRYVKTDSAIEIVSKNDLWKMDVRSEHSHIATKLATGSTEFSKAEQETLAIIAYKQPLKQSVLIKIRGNKAYDHVAKFKELNLIIQKKQGHTYELSLSNEFYDYFNVSRDKPLQYNDSSSEDQ